MQVDMTAIEQAAKAARAARLVLTDRVTTLQDEIEAAKKRKLPGIKTAVADVKEADAKLLAMLQLAPQLFVRPKSVVLHGIKLGYKKGSGSLEIADVDSLVKLVRKHFPEQFDLLVKTKHTPIKKALQNMATGDLKKLGVTVEGTTEVCFIQDATDSVDKLVAALLGNEEPECEAAE